MLYRGYQKRAAELENNWRDHFEEQTKRFEEKNDKMKYMVLLMGDAVDQEIVKAAAGAVATLTTYSSKLCQKVYESSQWEACFLNVLCSQVKQIPFYTWNALNIFKISGL